MGIRKRSGLQERAIGPNIILFIMSLTFIIPFIYIISISLSDNIMLRTYGYGLLPRGFTFEAYALIFAYPRRVIDAYLVTIFSSTLGTFLGVLIMAMVAYPLSRSTFKAKKWVMRFIFFTMLFGGGLIPTFILISYLGLIDSIWVYIWSGLINAFHIIIFRTFFMGIPDSVIESAKIDGASEFRIFLQMILPLSKPALATIALFVLLGRWNDWMTTLYFIRDSRLFTLQFLLQSVLRDLEFARDMARDMVMVGGVVGGGTLFDPPTESMRFALVVVTSGPMLVIFPFFQKYFAKGLTVGAVKG